MRTCRVSKVLRWNPNRVQGRGVCKGAAGPAVQASVVDAARVLHEFWEARGLVDQDKRQKLVDSAIEQLQGMSEPSQLQWDQPLPGVEVSWSSEGKATEVAQVSQRLLRLHELLGGEGVDVVWMVVREPQLLSADFAALTKQLWELKLQSLDLGVDLIKVLERQPALLLQQGGAAAAITAAAAASSASVSPSAQNTSSPSTTASSSTTTANTTGSTSVSSSDRTNTTPASSSRSSSRDTGISLANSDTTWGGRSSGSGNGSGAVAGEMVETASEKLQAWEYGLVTDNDREWARRLGQLEEYLQRHGDTHVGFRDGDDAELSRWASKQRAGHRRGELTGARIERLQNLGFEFNEEEAEWQRWYKELLAFKSQHGHCSPPPLATGVDFYLINWCSVQRVALRSKVMPAARQQLLDNAGFDWSGADPLS